jgi:hypothetical protein
LMFCVPDRASTSWEVPVALYWKRISCPRIGAAGRVHVRSAERTGRIYIDRGPRFSGMLMFAFVPGRITSF